MAKKQKLIVPRLNWLDHIDGDPNQNDQFILEEESVTPFDAYSNDEGVNIIFDHLTGRAYSVTCYGSEAPQIVESTLSQFTAEEL
jgi:hypothetical protein